MKNSRRTYLQMLLTMVLMSAMLLAVIPSLTPTTFAETGKTLVVSSAGRAPTQANSVKKSSVGLQNPISPESHTAEQMGKIAFASDRDGNFEIYIMDPDGGGQTRLTFTSSDNLHPSWSPDGNKIVFQSRRDGNLEIYSMNSDGSNQTRLTMTPPADNFDPAWSLDGNRIAFTSSRDGHDQIYLMDTDGKNQTNISQNRLDDLSPTFSPVGGRIAFTSNRDNHYKIFSMDSSGGNVVQLTSQSDADDINPFWSRTKITFDSNRDGNDQIYAMKFDGTNQTRLSNNSAYDLQPARSSEGSKIAFVSTRDGNFQIYAMNSDGSNPIRLTNNSASDIQPSVQPLPTLASQSSVQFSSNSYTADEGSGSVTITVTRTGNTAGAAAVDYAATPGSASDRSNFIPAFGTLNFAPGDTSKTFTVLIIKNGFLEPNKTVNLTLSNATGATLGVPNSATLTLINSNASASTTNPIDDPAFFVRQQYLDFLNRQPDDSGLAYWTGQITACNGDAACINGKRVDVSAAFFQSVEFQLSGFYVLRLYQAALGRFPTYTEFIRDRSQLIAGPNLLELQASFTSDFVDNRADFNSKFAGTSDAQYVDALRANTGNALTQADRDALVNGLANGTETRVTVLVKVVNNAAFTRQEFNPGFVLMEYFGYLRRDPDASGYAFWLNVLNTTGNFRGMVCAFITSAEYQLRFSSVISRHNSDCAGIG